MSEPNLTEKLITLITPLVAPLGYEIVHLEVHQGRPKTLRVFIDFAAGSPKAIGIEDCVTVTRALDEPLDQLPELEAVFGASGYELEVSSPGADRPLRTARDFERFAGREVKIHVYRPLTGEELGNEAYQLKNPKQKNFLGVLNGIQGDRVLLSVSSGKSDKKSAKKKAAENKNSAEAVMIPLPLISKANLEPKFDFDRTPEAEIAGS